MEKNSTQTNPLLINTNNETKEHFKRPRFLSHSTPPDLKWAEKIKNILRPGK